MDLAKARFLTRESQPCQGRECVGPHSRHFEGRDSRVWNVPLPAVKDSCGDRTQGVVGAPDQPDPGYPACRVGLG